MLWINTALSPGTLHVAIYQNRLKERKQQLLSMAAEDMSQALLPSCFTYLGAIILNKPKHGNHLLPWFSKHFPPTQFFQLETRAGKGMVSQARYFGAVQHTFIEQSGGKSESQRRMRKAGSGKKLNKGSPGSQREQHKPSEEGQGCLKKWIWWHFLCRACSRRKANFTGLNCDPTCANTESWAQSVPGDVGRVLELTLAAALLSLPCHQASEARGSTVLLARRSGSCVNQGLG